MSWWPACPGASAAIWGEDLKECAAKRLVSGLAVSHVAADKIATVQGLIINSPKAAISPKWRKAKSLEAVCARRACRPRTLRAQRVLIWLEIPSAIYLD